MSVNRYIEANKGTPDELQLIASKGQRVFVGTQAAVESAIKDGDIGENSVVYITDDYREKSGIQDFFDAIVPASTDDDMTTYLQSPGSLPPKEHFARMGIVSDWEIVVTEGEFIRLPGGKASEFGSGIQNEQIGYHNHGYGTLYATTNGYDGNNNYRDSSHKHIYNQPTFDNIMHMAVGAGSHWAASNENTTTGGSHTHPIRGSTSSYGSSSNENRPKNKTWQLWKRIA